MAPGFLSPPTQTQDHSTGRAPGLWQALRLYFLLPGVDCRVASCAMHLKDTAVRPASAHLEDTAACPLA